MDCKRSVYFVHRGEHRRNVDNESLEWDCCADWASLSSINDLTLYALEDAHNEVWLLANCLIQLVAMSRQR